MKKVLDKKKKKIKKTFLNIFRYVRIPLLILIIILGISLWMFSQRDIAAKVFDERIYKTEVNAAVRRKIKDYEDKNIELSQADIEAIRKNTINEMVENILLDHWAKEHGITVSDKEVQDEIERMRKATGLSEDEVYKQALSKFQLLESDIETIVREALLSDKVYASVLKDLKITDEEAWDYFIERTRFYAGARRVSHIFLFIDSTEDKPEDVEKKIEKLEEIRKYILNGEDFGKLARKFSDDESTKDKGGDLGWFRKGTISDPSLSKTVFSMNKGDVSEVIRGKFGLHIVKITDVVPESLSSLSDEEKRVYFEKIKELVKGDMMYTKGEERIKEFNKSLWELYNKDIKIGNPWDNFVSWFKTIIKKLEGKR